MSLPFAAAGRQRRRVLCALCAAFPCTALRGRSARAAEAPIEQVKAAYLLKFPGFVEWPAYAFASANSPFVIAVCGADDVYAEMRALALRHPVQGRRVALLRLRHPEPSTVTHLVFVGKDRSAQLPAWVAAYSGRPIVIVADTVGGLESGAALNFVEVGDRLRFEASPAAAEREGLRLSSRLLGVAERVLKERAS